MAEINKDTPHNAPSQDTPPSNPPAENPPADPPKEPDYKALAEQNAALAAAEKARADAAEALIVKNKNIQKRDDGSPQLLTEERVKELISEAQKSGDDSPEAKALTDAQAAVKQVMAKNEELKRALAGKDTVQKNPPSTHQDPLPEEAPKLAPGSPLADFKHLGNGLYSKKLATGKTMFKNTRAQGNERKSWVE